MRSRSIGRRRRRRAGRRRRRRPGVLVPPAVSACGRLVCVAVSWALRTVKMVDRRDRFNVQVQQRVDVEFLNVLNPASITLPTRGHDARGAREAWLNVELVERARNGDRDAFAQLVPMVADRLYAIAYRILRDPDLAQDALQNALVTAWRRDAPSCATPSSSMAGSTAHRHQLLHRVAPAPPLLRRRPRARRVRGAGDRRYVPRHGGSRRARACVPAAPARPAIGVRPPPLRGPAAGGGRRDARDPGGNGSLEAPLRDPDAAQRGRSRPPRVDGRTADGMIDDAGFERLALSWITDGPTKAPAETVRAAMAEIATTGQDRSGPWPTWLTRDPVTARTGVRARSSPPRRSPPSRSSSRSP